MVRGELTCQYLTMVGRLTCQYLTMVGRLTCLYLTMVGRLALSSTEGSSSSTLSRSVRLRAHVVPLKLFIILVKTFEELIVCCCKSQKRNWKYD